MPCVASSVIEGIYFAALERSLRTNVHAYLNEACEDDDVLRQ